ncbi:E3 ubiquitin protein ligase RIE1 [Porphyridium purpureum]|uniref:E3 ubiquitin protein ligase RIE1 n=1 Tax=Porphyridium purpureum TaxID=35688 RepID=A0A5J4YP56_PORPP|nr:E3 ubiquitin protein ligase RIE1 [Porphyridium purpureum]|eukprot:POR0345..scf222_8
MADVEAQMVRERLAEPAAGNAGDGAEANDGGQDAEIDAAPVSPSTSRARRLRDRALAVLLPERESVTWLDVVSLVYLFAFIIASIVVLVLEYHKPCDKPLKEWLIVNVSLSVAYLVLKRIGTDPPQSENAGVKALCKILSILYRLVAWTSIVWFYVGFFWVIESNTCTQTAPGIFNLSVVLIAINLALAVASLCFACCICTLVMRRDFRDTYTDGGQSAGGSMSKGEIDGVPEVTFQPGMYSDEDCLCAICLCEYEPDEKLRVLPCNHVFHSTCVDTWLGRSRQCPVCKQEIVTDSANARGTEPSADASSAIASSHAEEGIDVAAAMSAGDSLMVPEASENERTPEQADNHAPLVDEETRDSGDVALAARHEASGTEEESAASPVDPVDRV